MNRRCFLTRTLAATAALAPVARSRAQTPASAPAAAAFDPKRPEPLELARVREFVIAGHRNLPRVQAMLAEHPKLAFASYDWGGGDFETALGGAAHVGHRAIALHLLEAGARIDAFCAAMLGEAAVVGALLRLAPATARTRGPHGYSLLYHAGYGGQVGIGEAIAPHLDDRAAHFNPALHPAVLAGQVDFVAWLLQNGVTDPSPRDVQGKTPLDLALERKHERIAALLRDAGGRSTR